MRRRDKDHPFEDKFMMPFPRVYLITALLPFLMIMACNKGRWIHPELTGEEAKAQLAADTEYCSHEPVITATNIAVTFSNEETVYATCLKQRGWRWSPDK